MIKRYMTRCSASLIIKGNADQKHKRYHLIPVWMASTKKVRNDKWYWGCREKGTLMTESEAELNSLLMKVKEESEKVGLKLKA